VKALATTTLSNPLLVSDDASQKHTGSGVVTNSGVDAATGEALSKEDGQGSEGGKFVCANSVCCDCVCVCVLKDTDGGYARAHTQTHMYLYPHMYAFVWISKTRQV
jgi:hypothetical protein